MVGQSWSGLKAHADLSHNFLAERGRYFGAELGHGWLNTLFDCKGGARCEELEGCGSLRGKPGGEAAASVVAVTHCSLGRRRQKGGSKG